MRLFIRLSFTALAIAIAAIAQVVSAGGGSVGFISSGSFSANTAGNERGITGAPYSAEQITERVQTLADGTRITQPEQKTIYYRDSQGRTRIEHSFPLPPGAAADSSPTVIEIDDPIGGIHYMLNSRDHTVQKFSFPKALPLPPPPPPPNSTTAQARLTLAPPAGADAAKRAPQITRESLGTQSIEGILAEGSRSTMIYPAGAFGNDRPVTVIRESWRSPELKVLVLSKSSDPRSGDSTTRLTNISRTEPDPALFQIPADYKIVDNPANTAQ